jgi:hypothetical protein
LQRRGRLAIWIPPTPREERRCVTAGNAAFFCSACLPHWETQLIALQTFINLELADGTVSANAGTVFHYRWNDVKETLMQAIPDRRVHHVQFHAIFGGNASAHANSVFL